jgi:hypothetical protein
MYKLQIIRFLTGLLLAMPLAAQGFGQSADIRPSEACERTTFKTQAGNSLDLAVESRMEQRVEALQLKLFDLMVREMDLQARIEDLDFRLTPAGIQKALAFEATVRPMDDVRADLRAKLESQKARVNKLLEFVTASRERLEAEIRETDTDLKHIRERLRLP